MRLLRASIQLYCQQGRHTCVVGRPCPCTVSILNLTHVCTCVPHLPVCCRARVAAEPAGSQDGSGPPHTSNHEQDEALAVSAAAAASTAAAAAVLGAAAQDAADQAATAQVVAAQPEDATATLQAVAAVACPSSQLEWPAASGYCWYKRDSGNQQTGPGSNVFAASNVAVNTQDQLVLTVSNPKSQ
jgi:hypothetical protein